MISKSEIKYIINPEKLEEIRKKDSKPYFRAYVSAHEGSTLANLVGKGYRRFKWMRSAIEQINNFLSKNSVPFFIGHNNKLYNEPDRKQVGQVVGSALKDIGGTLHSVVVGYFNEKERKLIKDYDSISIEAQTENMESDTSGGFIVSAVKMIKGIALGKSQETPPAFTGAKLVGEVAIEAQTTDTAELVLSDFVEFVENFQEPTHRPQDRIMKLAEVKQLIKENQWAPEAIFSEQELKESEVVNRFANLKLNDYKAETEQKLAELKTKANKVEFKEKLDEYIKNNQIDEPLEKLLKLNTDEIQLKDNLDQSLQEYVQKQQKQYEKLQAIGLGVVKQKEQEGYEPVPAANTDGQKKEANPFM